MLHHYHHAALLLIAALAPTVCRGESSVPAPPACPSCQFDVEPSQEAACSVYSATSQTTLMPWHRANEDCLRGLDISLAAVDKKNFWHICPNPDGENVNVERLTNFLKSDTEAANAIKALYENELFVLSSSNGSDESSSPTYELPNQIVDRRNQVTDCTLSQKLCWGAVSWILAENPDHLSMICNKLWELQMTSLLEEQGRARETLCAAAASSAAYPNACEPLAVQIQEIKTTDGLSCLAIADTQTRDLPLPACEIDESAAVSFIRGSVVVAGAVATMLSLVLLQ